MPTRLIAIGPDTPDTKVPNSYQVALERGDNLGWYIMWNNDTGQPIEDVYVELVLPYGELDEEVATITSLYLDTNLYIGNETSFDVPPGHFEKSYEFELPTGGQLLFDDSIELKPNHKYRIVGVYDNPTGETLLGGGMAQIGGLFRPHDPAAWPENDPSDPLYQLDLSGLPEPLKDHAH